MGLSFWLSAVFLFALASQWTTVFMCCSSALGNRYATLSPVVWWPVLNPGPRLFKSRGFRGIFPQRLLCMLPMSIYFLHRGCWKPTFTELPQFLPISTLCRNFSEILTSQQNPSLVANTHVVFFPLYFYSIRLFYWWSRPWTLHFTVSSDFTTQSLRCVTWSNDKIKVCSSCINTKPIEACTYFRLKYLLTMNSNCLCTCWRKTV